MEGKFGMEGIPESENFTERIGTEAGSRWSDVLYKGRKIRRITLWFDKFLDAIMVEYDIKLGIKSTKHGTGSKNSKSRTIHISSNDHVRQVNGKACNFYGQIMFTSIYVYTELGQKYGPFGDFDDPDREYENFSVGGQYCRLQYLSGKTERNEREQWITQLGFHWEYIFEEEFYSCGMSSLSIMSTEPPSSFKLDRLHVNSIQQTISTSSINTESLNKHPIQPMIICQKLLKQIQDENDQLRNELKNITHLSVDRINCHVCSQDGDKVALPCGHLVCRTCFTTEDMLNCPICGKELSKSNAIFLIS